ncbi:MAG: zinc ABC transporter substrate-binding protein [Bacteroidota bacterium]
MLRYPSTCILLLLFLLRLSAQVEEEQLPLVVASASIFADMAEVIGGNLIEVQSVVPIGGDPHIYEPTPADVRLIARADLVLINGLTFEGWMSELIDNSGTRAEVVTVTNGLNAIASEEYANASDPHAWMSAKNGRTYVANIRDALIRLNPENAEAFRFNANMYLGQIQDLDTYIQAQIARIPAHQRILITSHDAFRYYGRRYGIQVEAAMGTSTDAEVQTSDVARLTHIIRETKVPAIFVESTINPKLIRQIAADNGAVIGGNLYADSLGEPDGEAGTYLKMLRRNTDIIVNGLLGKTSEVDTQLDTNPIQQASLLGIILAVMIGAFGYMVWQLDRGVK